MLSNGQLMVGLNEHGLVHDFYYPYVGLDNLTTARSVHHKIGIWVDGIFSWIDDGSWETKVSLESDALFANSKMSSRALNICIDTIDFVDPNSNGFIRRLKVSNLSTQKRDVRLFMHQVFEISSGGRGDTAMYVPDANYILDYKGRCALLICGRQQRTGNLFDQYSVGNYGIEGKEGTYKDAEDGSLSGNSIEHGGVDSVFSFAFEIDPSGAEQVDYWIIASGSQYECEEIHDRYLKEGIDHVEEKARDWWKHWIGIGANRLHGISPELLPQVKKSLMTIKAHTDKRGGVLASGDSSIFNYGRDYYCYCWPRDGAYAMWPLIRLGYKEEPKKFFEFCRDTLSKQGYLMHKYQPDQAIGSTWHPLVHENRKELAIQEDETASVINMLGEYLDYTGDEDFVRSLYSTLIQPAANFMAQFIDEETNLPHASYDLWEEKFLTNTYSTATVIGALKRASQLAEKFNFPDDAVKWEYAYEKITSGLALLFDHERETYRKGFILQADGSLNFDNTIDTSSLFGIIMYTNIDLNSEEVKSSLYALESNLLNLGPVGGVIRYENDNYMRKGTNVPPNPWFVCSLWLAQMYIQLGKIDQAKQLLAWSLKYTLEGGIMSEQIHPETGQPLGVAPLVWSHAELINTSLDLVNK